MKRYHGATGGALSNSLARRNSAHVVLAQVQISLHNQIGAQMHSAFALRMIISAQVIHHFSRWTVVYRLDKQHSEG